MNPVLTTFNMPRPTGSVRGMIIGLSRPSTASASSRSSMPSRRGTENPQMSASSTPTVKPSPAIAAARLTVTDDLPTPPLPLAMARIRVDAETSVFGAFSRAFQRALVITSERSSLVISPQSIVTLVTPGCTATLVSTSFLIWARNGQPPIVSFTPTVTTPSGLTSTRGTMPSVTMSAPSSGSITDRSSCVTVSTSGGLGITASILRLQVVTMTCQPQEEPTP